MPGDMQYDPGVASSIVQSGRSSRLLESRRRERERNDVEQKVALALRCDDAKMSLVVRKNEKVCAVFIQKASLEHPPPRPYQRGGREMRPDLVTAPGRATSG